jgi:hypothetical protein
VTTELSYRSPPVAGFRDRSSMLLVVGIFFIIAGGLCGCAMASTPMAFVAPRPAGTPAPRAANLLVGLCMYAVLCAALMSLGIGCIRKRRWVRPLILVFGWIGLIGGVIGMIVWGFTMPQMANAMRAAAPPGATPPPAAFFKILVIVMTVFFAFIYVIIPALLLWLFRSSDVEATLRHYDPHRRWTDDVPLPVLGLAALLAVSAFWALTSIIQGWFAAFGLLLTGAPARLLSLLIAGLLALAAWLTFRRRPAGWWMAMALLTIVPLAWITTLLRRDMVDLYRAMGMSDAELRVIANMQVVNSTFMAICVSMLALASLAFAWYARKWFFNHELQTPAPPHLESR